MQEETHLSSWAARIRTVSEYVKERLENYRRKRMMETDTGHVLFNQKLDMQIMVIQCLDQAVRHQPDVLSEGSAGESTVTYADQAK
jgi:hypothetical protein